MRWFGARVSRIAAGLGVVALAVNAAVPVVLAFLLTAALAPAQPEWAPLQNGGWVYYGPLCHHDDGGQTGDHRDKSPGAPCPVCSFHGVLAITLPAPVAAPAAPTKIAAVIEPLTASGLSAGIVHCGYRSRAPPTV
jgi:hypothetical protein